MSDLILFSDRGCPFAHRVLALVHHLGLELDHRESVLGTKPPGLEHYAASKPIPLLVDGTLVLTESRVMLEHLAEREGYTEALPADLPTRSLHRHAMAVADMWVGAVLNGRRALEPGSAKTNDVLDALEAATTTGPVQPNLLALQLAPLWFHLSRLRPHLPLTAAIRARPPLAAWLDEALALPCVRATTQDLELLRDDLANALKAGQLDLADLRSAS